MDYEPEKMTIDVMERMINCAYNDVTFRNALVCALDWCNHQRCTNIHKDTRIGVNRDGERIERYEQVDFHDKYQLTEDTEKDISKKYFEYDASKDKYYRVDGGSGTNPHALGWYEYINPSDIYHNWYEKIKTIIEYSKVPKDDVSYFDSPSVNKWYKKDEWDAYYPSTETHCRGIYSAIAEPDSSASPRENDWYEKTGSADPDVPENYTPSGDNNVVSGKTYYICSYYSYYKQISRPTKGYDHTTDTVIQEGKAYYTQKDVYKYLPENPDDWDYSDHYEKHIDITVKGVDSEITLQNKRPVTAI